MKENSLLRHIADLRKRLPFPPPGLRLRAALARIRSRRNVLFLYQSYYHFWYLAKALRRRGWNAVVVNQEPPDGGNAAYYHGEDISCFGLDPEDTYLPRRLLQAWALRVFNFVHIAGDGCLSFFPEHFGWGPDLAPDLQRWKKTGKKIGYTISGCLSGVTQSEYAAWSAGDRGVPACSRCRWRDVPEVCSDAKSQGFAAQIRHCDLICAETMPALGGLARPQTVFDPLTMCLDPDIWSPDLSIPPEHRLDRAQGEFLILHAMSNYTERTRADKVNIKGTPAIEAAVERLRGEGEKASLVFVTAKTNLDLRYYQLQCDLIVDQLNLGCYGAIAREGMMLGRPVICRINPDPGLPGFARTYQAELPLISADEETIYDVLKFYLHHRELLPAIGAAGRAYALKWHSAEACAARYEKVYDAVMAGRNPAEVAG
ncbi:MAG: hypothetical protein LBJ82_06665 [Deltaproteobacteria bacterium]|jgi:hypothetical protein|nr:hypothetical protein [Deltaproteobacteria bacterium]